MEKLKSIILILQSREFVGKSFIDIGDIYCFGKGLLMLMCKDMYQCLHFMHNNKLTLQIFEISPNLKKLCTFI